MSGIAGVARAGQTDLVNQMLHKMSHRGPNWRETFENQGTTFGAVGSKIQTSDQAELKYSNLVCDRAGHGHFAYNLLYADIRLVYLGDPAPYYFPGPPH